MKFVDLFAGCGGFSEGFYHEGFESILHVDFDKSACLTIAERMRFHGYPEHRVDNEVVCGDLTNQKVHEHIDKVINGREFDVLVGGPPCQSFSSVGRAQDPDSMRNDPRNYLFKSYLEILERYQPKFFVFENVSGLLSAKPGGNPIFPEIISAMSRYYNVCDDKKTVLLNSVHYGVPQIRKRVILIGVRKDLGFKVEEVYNLIEKTHFGPDESEGSSGRAKFRTVKDAIADLPKLKPGLGENKLSWKPDKKNEYIKQIRPNGFPYLYNHVARKHNLLDRERYKILSKNNWQLKELAVVRPDLVHHDPRHFGNRYTVQEYAKPGRTVVAHLYKDGNLFIHPDPNQERTFTVREAARIQSFPDNFNFLGSRTDQFKQVGNAVPPLMAQAIARALKKIIHKLENGVRS